MSTPHNAYTRSVRPEHCCYCGIVMSYAKVDGVDVPHKATKDHIQPLRGRCRDSKVSKRMPLVWCCASCNVSKRDLSLSEWRVIRAMRGACPLFWFEVQLPVFLIRLVCARMWWMPKLVV